jgi:phosphohistidine phosphatase
MSFDMLIYLLRHGIAEPAGGGVRDPQRALTPEGKKKLRSVLKVAARAGVVPVVVMSSPYKRALETAAIAIEELRYKEDLLRTQALLPGAPPNEVWEEIRAHRDASAILLVGHEPLFSGLAAYLLGVPELQVDFKKGALVAIETDQVGASPKGALKWMLTARLAQE